MFDYLLDLPLLGFGWIENRTRVDRKSRRAEGVASFIFIGKGLRNASRIAAEARSDRASLVAVDQLNPFAQSP